MILIAHQHELKPPASLGLHDRGRFGQIENGCRLERVAVHPNHVLFVDRNRHADVQELTEGVLFNIATENDIGLGTDVVFHRDFIGRGS